MNIKFTDGLVPAIIQDYENGEVLMLAYMNEESLKDYRNQNDMVLQQKKKKLWNKGETSGHYQYVKKIYYDCDEDTILIKVIQVGAACHTGNRTCFYREITI